MRWERLPADTAETCDVDEWGWSRTSATRCGKRADWIDRSTCGCGAHDMTIRECDEHHQKREKEDAERKAKFDAEFEVAKEILPGGVVKYSRRRKNETA